MTKTYLVVSDIDMGWETTANAGDLLTVEPWGWDETPTLMLGDKAVCDEDSLTTRENCEPLD